MSTLLSKLLSVKCSSNGCANNSQAGNDPNPKKRADHARNGSASSINPISNDKKQSYFGADCIRILLFRECESRGRKLLFDSVKTERKKLCNDLFLEKNINCYGVERALEPIDRTIVKNVICNGLRNKLTSDNDSIGLGVQNGKLWGDDINLLGEMIFGSVAMTYRGSSFKIHAMNSPECILCTKIFPYSEYNGFRRSSKQELTKFENSGSSSSSSTSLHNQPSSLLYSSSDLSSNSSSSVSRKSSTSSSNESELEVELPWINSQGSNALSSSSGSSNSLNSLRHRWYRVKSTSLGRSESDDCQNSIFKSTDFVKGRHKTRIALAILLQLPWGHEREISTRLMEHAALLEGMLDRLRHSCFKTDKSQSLIKQLSIVKGCNLRLLLHLLRPEKYEAQTSPLLWHELLLNASMPVQVQVTSLHRSLQQMCRLLDELDTKSTNFFLSTIITAVLTHHLGWVHTAPPHQNRQQIENMSQQYPCNPIWAQLNDLYGALGAPVRICHTVIAGEPDKIAQIEATLNFISYFLRSGLVKKREETRCSAQEDVLEACAILERHFRNNPALRQKTPKLQALSIKKPSATKTERTEDVKDTSAHSLLKSDSFEEIVKDTCSEAMNVLSEMKDLTYSSAVNKDMEDLTLDGLKNGFENSLEVKKPIPSKTKIIVSEKVEEKRDSPPTTSNNSEELKNELSSILAQKNSASRRQKLTAFEELESQTKSLDKFLFPSTVGEDMARQAQSPQVYFSLESKDKPTPHLSIRERLQSSYVKCQCSYTFTRVPSTSAELPEGILRKIIQRNFPESSKNISSPSGEYGVCYKCRQGYADVNKNGKLMLETPTNATELQRGCNSSSRTRVPKLNSLEALIEGSCIIELPMPRSKKVPTQSRNKVAKAGFTKGAIYNDVYSEKSQQDTGYGWGMVVQGLTKKVRKTSLQKNQDSKKEQETEEKWWMPIQQGLSVDAKFPLIDQPISEALCIIGDLDNWQVGLLSNSSSQGFPVHIGMSRLVSSMLEAFSYTWKEYHSPEQCIKLLESRLREMWLRSKTLIEFLSTADARDINLENLTNFLDVDTADLPLLLAVASTHSPRIAERFALTL